jgi:hypothetical protein
VATTTFNPSGGDDVPQLLSGFLTAAAGDVWILSPGTWSLNSGLSLLNTPLTIQAWGAWLQYNGTEVSGTPVLQFGWSSGNPNASTNVQPHRLFGARVTWNADDGAKYAKNGMTGVQLQNCYRPQVDGLAVRGFWRGLELYGLGTGFTNGNISLDELANNRVALYCHAAKGGYVTQTRIQNGICQTTATQLSGVNVTYLYAKVDDGSSNVDSITCDHVDFEGHQSGWTTAANFTYGSNYYLETCRYESDDSSSQKVIIASGVLNTVLRGWTNGDFLWTDNNASGAITGNFYEA